GAGRSGHGQQRACQESYQPTDRVVSHGATSPNPPRSNTGRAARLSGPLPRNPTNDRNVPLRYAPQVLLEGDHARDLPLVPHLVDLGLEVGEVFLGEVSEAALLQEVLAGRLAGSALHQGLGLPVVADDAVL